MKISKNWLNDLVKVEDFKTLSDKFNLMSMENNYFKGLNSDKIVIGHVLTKTPHPDADKLNVLEVDVKTEVLQIVCGAKNVEAGQKVIISLVDAVLPGDFKIKKSKIRGVESNGMCCSLTELGIKESIHQEDGIHVLNQDAPIGENALNYIGLNDEFMELDLTPNRSDLLSYIGTSYDVCAILGKEVNIEEVKIEENFKTEMTLELDTENCKTFMFRVLKDVVVKESPDWLKYRLMNVGIKPINNIVDITNYVLFQTGHPLHAYDLDKFDSNEVVVRLASEGEEFITLDKTTRTLINSDVVVTNGKVTACLAGVMGGLESSITNNTKNILLETAIFNPTSVRKTSQRLNLRSDSSVRFEKGMSSYFTKYANDLATSLLVKYADAKLVSELVSIDEVGSSSKSIEITLNYINKVVGITTTEEVVNDIFVNKLKFKSCFDKGVFKVEVPSRRVDVNTKQDLIEEFVRIYGFENIPNTLPSTTVRGGLSRKQKNRALIKNLLTGIGLDEVITYSLVSENQVYDFVIENKDIEKVLSPLSEYRHALRQTSINGMVEVVSYNQARKIHDLQIFEISEVYSKDEYHEELTLAFSGIQNSSLHQGKKEVVDFYYVKGIVERIASTLRINLKYVSPEKTNPNFNINQTAYLYHEEKLIGYIGKIHPKCETTHSVKDVFVVSLSLDFSEFLNDDPVFTEINKYPSITRDLALVCKNDVESEIITNIIKKVSKKTLHNLTIFDVYKGVGLEDDEKSIAYKLEFISPERTLETEEVNKLVDKILYNLNQEGIRLR